MQYEELTEKIIGCAFTVYNKLGFGYLESVYEKAMMIELQKTGLHAESQYPITVYYDNDEIIGEFRADIYVENTVIVELKSVIHIVKEFEVKLVNHLVSTKKDVGVLINFGEKQVEVKRKVRFLNSQDKI